MNGTVQDAWRQAAPSRNRAKVDTVLEPDRRSEAHPARRNPEVLLEMIDPIGPVKQKRTRKMKHV